MMGHSNTSFNSELPEGVTTKTIAGCIEIFENIFSQEVAEKIIKLVEDTDKDTNCHVSFNNARVNHGEERLDIRSNQVMPLEPHRNANNDICECEINNINIFLREKLTPCVLYYQEKYSAGIDFDEGLQLLKYFPGKEYKAHSDHGPGHDYRIVSGLIYLNPSQYEGGATYFQNFDVNLKVDSPSIVLFPSNYAYTHRARPVLSGIKYAVVTWFGYDVGRQRG